MSTELSEKRKRLACQWSADQLGRACDGELSESEWERFTFHAAQCPQCKLEFETLQRQIVKLRALRRRELSESFVFETVQRIGVVQRSSVRFNSMALRFATLVVVCGVGLVAATDHGLNLDTSALRQYGMRLPAVQVDYVDSASLQPVELDMVLHRAHEQNQSVRLSPVVPAVDRHRRAVIEEAAYQTVAADLGHYGDMANIVQLGEPVELYRPDASPFVVVVETGN